MHSKMNIIFITIFTLIISGCGHSLKENTALVPTAPYNAIGQGKTIVILPLADYSGEAYNNAQRRDLLISEALMDNLALNGFKFPIAEDVFGYLEDKNITSTATSDSALADDLNNGEWSEQMREVLTKEQNRKYANKKKGITNEEILEIGKQFNANYILRGRIVEFKTRQDTSFNPFKRGIAPFIVETSSRVALGFADTDSDTGETYFQMGSRATGMVELRLWVQNASTGEVMWTNHTNIEVAPCCIFSDPQQDKLYSTAIKYNASRLIHDFAKNGLK